MFSLRPASHSGFNSLPPLALLTRTNQHPVTTARTTPAAATSAALLVPLRVLPLRPSQGHGKRPVPLFFRALSCAASSSLTAEDQMSPAPAALSSAPVLAPTDAAAFIANNILISPKRISPSPLSPPPSPIGRGYLPPAPVVTAPAPPQQASSAASATGFGAELSKALKSVCRVFTTHSAPNYSTPWQMHSQTKSTASGFIISPLSSRRILTNAHAVANQVQVLLRKHGNARKFPAKVLAVGHECDIAMLTVEDDEFWTGVEALDIHGLPSMQESVTVVGYPTGGDNVCVTKGVVSRIDRQTYSHGRTPLLTIQIDAAINSGNSGGPVMMGDRAVGIAFQCLTQAESCGYIIPVPVIHHFLQDLQRHQGRYTGFCDLGISWQNLESQDMKASLGMPSSLTGVMVINTEQLYDAHKVLRVGDVITHLDGQPIADDGTILFHHNSRIDFRHLVSMHFHGDSCNLRLWRDGASVDVKVRLCIPKQLVPVHSHDIRPSYYVYAGLVFTRLTCWYLKSAYGTDWHSKAPIKLCERAFCGSMADDGEEIVLLSKVLASDVNQGYQDISNLQVNKCNGVKVHNLAHLAKLLEGCKQPYARLELAWHKVMMVNVAKAKASADEVLRNNCIPTPGYFPSDLLSSDLSLPEALRAETDAVLGVTAAAAVNGIPAAVEPVQEEEPVAAEVCASRL